MFLLYFYFGYIAEVGTGGLGNLTGDMSFLQTDFSLSTYPGRVVRTVTRFVLAGGVTGIIFVTRKLLTHRRIGYIPRCLLHASNTT